MRKIIFSNYDDVNNPFYGGGGSHAIHYIAKKLAEMEGFEVTVNTGKFPGSRDETIDGVFYRRIGLNTGPKLSQLIFQFILWYYVLTTRFDVWFESFTPPLSTACLQVFTRKPVIGVTHLLGAASMMKKYKLPFIFIERLGLKTYDYVIAISGHIASQINAASPKTKVSVIPNGIEKTLIDLNISKGVSDYMFFIGRIDIEHKGLDFLLNAYKMIAEKTQVKLIIAGSGRAEEVDWLKSRIQELGLSGRIEYLGKASNQQKSELFAKSLFVVMPSRFEGQGLVALEAFAHRTTVVTFDIPDLDWIPAEVSVKVPAFDEAKLAQAMWDLANHNQKRKELEDNAKQFVKSFDWDLVVQKYAELIDVVAPKK